MTEPRYLPADIFRCHDGDCPERADCARYLQAAPRWPGRMRTDIDAQLGFAQIKWNRIVMRFLLIRFHFVGLWIYRFSSGCHWATSSLFSKRPAIAGFFSRHGCRVGEWIMRTSTRAQRHFYA